jgi:uracil-DNA glycosylase
MLYSGPSSPKALIIGDFPNHEEAKPGSRNYGGLFTNKAGGELRKALDAAGLPHYQCGYTYAMQSHPEKSNPDNLCGKKGDMGKDYAFPAYGQGKYFHPQYIAPALENLRQIIETYKPQLLIPLGNVACWLVLESAKINSLRGSVFADTKWGLPAIATYSFGQIMKEWSLRPIAVFDFMKAKRFLAGEYHQPHRRILIEPTLDELTHWLNTHIWSAPDDITQLSVDIETARGQITCVGLAPSDREAVVIPFFDPDAVDRGKNYWRTIREEFHVWELLRAVLESGIPKLGQNFLYDLQYLRRYRISPVNYNHDTMVRHHSLFPEMRKDLGFLATIYTDEQPWKMLRNRNRDALKQED